MTPPLKIYLDTQDYSRLDDARAGRGRGKDAEILEQLLTLKKSGVARFVYSAMNISELLKYEGGGRELTLRKAETLTLLSDHLAYINPSRLIAYQLAERLVQKGDLPKAILGTGPISDHDQWFPRVTNLLGDLGIQKKQMIERSISGLAVSRHQKRMLRAKASKLQLINLPKESFDAFRQKYPFSERILTRTLPLLMDGKISAREAERQFLNEMGDPERYVIWFFEISKGDKSTHDWMRYGGERLAKSIKNLQERLSPFLDMPEASLRLKEIANRFGQSIPKDIISRFPDELAEFGVSSDLMNRALGDADFLQKVPFVSLWSNLLPEFFMQHSGLLKSTRKVRESDGGDIFHTLTLPYCDLWRGDVYFSELVRRHAPPESAKIVSHLDELPGAISKAWANNLKRMT